MLEGKTKRQLFVYKSNYRSCQFLPKYGNTAKQCNFVDQEENLIFRKNAPNPKWPTKYDRVIVLVRDPFDALLAEFNRKKAQRNFKKKKIKLTKFSVISITTAEVI